MKINDLYSRLRLGDPSSNIEKLERPESDKTTNAGESRKRADQVNVSSIGRQIQYYLEIARSVPDLRMEQVDGLKRAHQNGHYEVDPERLARKIISQGDEIDFIL